MPDLGAILERESRTVGQEPGALERVRVLRNRRRRNRRVGSALLALTLTLGALGYAWTVFHEQGRQIPADAITIGNVGDLHVAWSKETATGTAAVSGNEVWTASWGNQQKATSYRMEASPLDCSLGAVGCVPRPVATLGLDFNGSILFGADTVFTGAGPAPRLFGIGVPGETNSKLPGSISAYPRSCPVDPCAALWKGAIGAAGHHDYLTPIAEFGSRVYATTTKGGALFAFSAKCPRQTCRPIW